MREGGKKGRRNDPPLGLHCLTLKSFGCFGSDVEELIGLLASERVGGGGGVRPSRVRSMLASRACRSSVMIGTALSKQKMTKILHQLAGLDSPWNCPHGRPTMRHLVDLATLRGATAT